MQEEWWVYKPLVSLFFHFVVCCMLLLTVVCCICCWQSVPTADCFPRDKWQTDVREGERKWLRERDTECNEGRLTQEMRVLSTPCDGSRLWGALTSEPRGAPVRYPCGVAKFLVKPWTRRENKMIFWAVLWDRWRHQAPLFYLRSTCGKF